LVFLLLITFSFLLLALVEWLFALILTLSSVCEPLEEQIEMECVGISSHEMDPSRRQSESWNDPPIFPIIYIFFKWTKHLSVIITRILYKKLLNNNTYQSNLKTTKLLIIFYRLKNCWYLKLFILLIEN